MSIIFIAHICVCITDKHSWRVSRPVLDCRIC